MRTDEIIQASLHASSQIQKRSRLLLIVFFCMILLGAAVFLSTITGPNAARAWQAYLVNFVFWTGMAFGAVLFVAIMNMTSAQWSRPIKRFAEAPGAFLPAACVLFTGLYFGRGQIFPWIHKPVAGKQLWLDADFLFVRDGAGLGLLTMLSLVLIYQSVNADRKAAAQTATGSLLQQVQQKPQAALSIAFGIVYAIVLSLIAIDLIMSLDPHWVSTLFGAYYFMGSFYTALAGLMVLCGISLSAYGLQDFIMPKQFHDLGKLLLGFCVVTGDFFYSQFLVIWYGNLPEEAQYVILRVRNTPWQFLAWTVLIVCFALPFVILLNRKIKMKPRAMVILGIIILIGMWLERLLMVAPSLWRGAQLPLGMIELLISAGFLGIMALCVLLFLRQFPILPLSDPLFIEMLKSADEHSREAAA
jgi:Ni/Fe-hydrogenase subunit HybB-like protein